MKLKSELTAVLFFAGAAFAETPSAIIDQDKAWAAAVTKSDTAALGRLLADDLVYTHSTGAVDTKKVYIDSIKSGVQKYITVEHQDPKVQMAGDAAVLTSGLKMHTEREGKPQTAQFRLIHVWAKKGGHWQMLAHQTTRLP
jgi:ketosteroid isomerase-like protein